MFKVKNENTSAIYEICSNLTIMSWTSFGVFIVNFEHISHSVLLFPLLTLNKQMPAEYPQNMSQFVLVNFYKVILLDFRSFPNIFKAYVILNFKTQRSKSI